jgi:hypothetical protein
MFEKYIGMSNLLRPGDFDGSQWISILVLMAMTCIFICEF